jgi:hypothetical protein
MNMFLLQMHSKFKNKTTVKPNLFTYCIYITYKVHIYSEIEQNFLFLILKIEVTYE